MAKYFESIPLSGSSSWIDIDEESIKMCNELQYEFWRVILRVLRMGTPKVSLLAESGSMYMRFRIWLQKLCFARRILNGEEGLAKEVYET